jgi:hypothetical protein
VTAARASRRPPRLHPRRLLLAAAWLLAALPQLALAAAATQPAADPAPASAPPAGAASTAAAGLSAAGLYDLANAYARAGKPGLAVLNYERARLLSPGDPDLAANERHVRDSVRLPSDAPSALERLVGWIPPAIAAWIGVLGLLLGSIPFLARAVLRPLLRRIAGVLGATALAVPVCQGLLLWPTLHEGVVVTGTAPVRVSPVPMGESLFTLNEAETVAILDRHEEYALIRTRSGRSGWVALTQLVPVVPAH